MGRRTQQRRRRRLEELMALRHDAREFRRRWLARVDAWCASLRARAHTTDSGGGIAGVSRGIIESVLRELAEIGEPEGSPLALETRARLEAACRNGAWRSPDAQAVTESAASGIQPLEVRVQPSAQPRGKTA